MPAKMLKNPGARNERKRIKNGESDETDILPERRRIMITGISNEGNNGKLRTKKSTDYKD